MGLLKKAIEVLGFRYSFKDEFYEDMPEYFDALDEGIQSLNAQLQGQELLKQFKIKHGKEDLITAGEAAALLEAVLIKREQ